jgi:1,4-alpha-glucan branching enzyme
VDASDATAFREGTSTTLHQHLGAHFRREGGQEGVRFTVWAPGADAVAVIGEFDGWQGEAWPMERREELGLWSTFVPSLSPGTLYKYRVQRNGTRFDKADPMAFATEMPPGTASVLHRSEHVWRDQAWMASRAEKDPAPEPMSIYEVHFGSWMLDPSGRWLEWEAMAEPLLDHVKKLGFTHVEFLPLMEHPFHGSWGYQCTAWFSPTRRFGDPDGLKALVDRFHREGVGVILDWVPSHFPRDAHGLYRFDGTPLYEAESEDFHNPWNTVAFDWSKPEVRAFLLSSARWWLETYHADGLRVDAVASMLRPEGEPGPDRRANPDAEAFLRELNRQVRDFAPGAVMAAEESGSHPGVTKATEEGGLGFSVKWDMGWSHDTLEYMANDPELRRHHQDRLTFRSVYAHQERFVLPLSHDDVAFERGSLWEKIPGDEWQKYASLRLLYAYMYALPGKKLLFMGSEFGQRTGWHHDEALAWGQIRIWERSRGLMLLVGDLNRLMREHEALHALDFSPDGYAWVDGSDSENSVLSFLRHGRSEGSLVLAAFNFRPSPRTNYRIGVPRPGHWAEIFNSDATVYGGSGQGNLGGLEATPVPAHGRYHSLTTTLPPLGAVFFSWTPR